MPDDKKQEPDDKKQEPKDRKPQSKAEDQPVPPAR